MAPKINLLVLSRCSAFFGEVQTAVRELQTGHENVRDVLGETHLCDTPENIPYNELQACYNILIVDKVFNGNAQDTSLAVRDVRATFSDPMIAVELSDQGGEIFSLLVAGCNMFSHGLTRWELLHHLTNNIFAVSTELIKFRRLRQSQSYQQVA